MKSSLTSTIAGGAVAILGLLPLLWMMGSTDEQSIPAAALVAVAATTTTTVTTTVPEPVIVTIEPTTPDLEGVGDAATRVLYANGYARYTAPTDLEDDLPASVVRLLIERGVTLTVAVDAETESAP